MILKLKRSRETSGHDNLPTFAVRRIRTVLVTNELHHETDNVGVAGLRKPYDVTRLYSAGARVRRDPRSRAPLLETVHYYRRAEKRHRRNFVGFAALNMCARRIRRRARNTI